MARQEQAVGHKIGRQFPGVGPSLARIDAQRRKHPPCRVLADFMGQAQWRCSGG